MRTNEDKLVTVSVLGEVSSPKVKVPYYRVGHDGQARITPFTGGITYNVRVGDRALGWAADHVEPGASVKHSDEGANGALNLLACVGNEAVVVSGDAKGARGIVTGKHGGIEHVLVDFAPSDLEKMTIGDKVQIRARGQGLELEDFPGIRVMNIDPDFLGWMGVEVYGAKLRVPVVGIVPAELMGSGMGSPLSESGDYDITTQDPEVLREHGLEDLRLGDVVAIRDMSGFYGYSYRRGSVIIGIVVHTDSFISGHGPGVTCLMSCNDGEIEPVKVEGANIAGYIEEKRKS